MNGNEFAAAWEVPLRLWAFFGVLAVLVLWELKAPRRIPVLPRRKRWPGNLGIVALDTLLVRLLIPMTGAGMAVLAAAQGWGLLNVVPIPFWLAVLLSVVLLDLAIYGQHVLFHTLPPLWRVHRMHHADLEVDVTTGARFHPIEIVLSLLIKLSVIVALGAPATAVVLFEILLNATSMFNHSNVRLPPTVEALLRRVIVTPDMHRVHHSIKRQETDSNFGFNLSLWDRLFGTYRARPEDGHEAMALGIPDFRDPRDCTTLSGMLTIPFRGRAGHASRLEPGHEGH
ncbi:sterol desaturase family protein [Pelomicrobium sp.]|jgi:sterol desaturase/sphingolipid hydroxylase (fatty acid hydroxylase superfamily)|uniref:sterol desaturase family protein n=1 Tax=Pelomicrobium sp. TaxID=2815319 RepID=UPI002FDCDB87